VPGSPYTDLDRPPLDPRALRRATGGLWTRVDLREETGSTNADAAAAARDGEPEGLVVTAERQTAGRGRLGRAWVSPPRAGIAASVLLRPGVADPERGWPAVPQSRYGWLPLLAGVALAEAVDRVAELPDGEPVGLKWPNDLLVGDPPAKCAGILAEAVPDGVVLGVGLNVTVRADELPAGPNGTPATSLRLRGAAVTDRGTLLLAFLRGLESWYGRWRLAGGDATAAGLRDAYLERCATVGREVRVLLPDGNELTGTAESVDGTGRLVVRTAAGPQPIGAGDILHLR
jgi:BirA family biotin operon repressor/biotin-[acetyl-CoA-carboxylase] ligase